jgi:hypothetical protein
MIVKAAALPLAHVLDLLRDVLQIGFGSPPRAQQLGVLAGPFGKVRLVKFRRLRALIMTLVVRG